MREECELHKNNSMSLLQYIFHQPTTNAVADIREIDAEEPLSNALVPLFQNQSSTLIFSSGRISVTVNYPGGLHCPTQPFA